MIPPASIGTTHPPSTTGQFRIDRLDAELQCVTPYITAPVYCIARTVTIRVSARHGIHPVLDYHFVGLCIRRHSFRL
jgi:hypothetical protein